MSHASEESGTGFSQALQSMRGLAAVLVLAGHCFGVFALETSHLRHIQPLLNGEGAVVFFFVLSGFVLSLQWEKVAVSARPMASFAIRRITRLYPMLAITTIVGTIYCNLIHDPAPLAIATDWFNSYYRKEIDPFHMLLALSAYSGRPAAPLWSLFVEIIGSALVPLFIVAATTATRKYLIGLLLLGVSFALDVGLHFNYPVYLIDFYIGVSIAWWGPALTRVSSRLAAWLQPALPILLIGLFLVARGILPEGTSRPVINLIELACSAPIVALLYYGGWRPNALRIPAFTMFGDISFSLYLLHFPLMYLNVHLLTRWSNSPAAIPVEMLTITLTLATLALTTAVSLACYRYVEMPFIALGRNLTRRYCAPVPAPA
jgi:peptidoglycan/LPS O-acetylase OafA/YrhL